MTDRSDERPFRLTVIFTGIGLGVILSFMFGRPTVLTGGAASAAPERPLREDEGLYATLANVPSSTGDVELVNPSFEGDWEHTPTDVYNAYGHYIYTAPFGEIFVPEGWTAFFRHGPPVAHDDDNDVGWAQPEVHVIKNEPPFLDPPRVYSGQQALKLFTFWKIHDAGLYQQVSVPAGIRWRLFGWVHAWTSDEDDAHQSTGDPIQAWLMVGMDPTGGTNPYSETIIWGEAAHIYDVYAKTPALELTTENDTLTVFIRSWTLWPYKHNDVYWDAIALQPVYEGPLPTLTAEPEAGTAYQQESISYTLALGTTAELTAPLKLTGGSVSGAVSGFYPSIVQPGDTATMIITPSLSTHSGTYSTTIAAGGTIAKDGIRYPITSTTQVSLTVLPVDFALEIVPGTARVLKGGTASYQIELTSTTPGFSGPVALDVTDIPSGTLSHLTPSSVESGTQATVTITTTKQTPAGMHMLTISGAAGEVERTTMAALEVWMGTFLPIIMIR